jgi:ADP-ribosyl-[dinitrogen reductase] hydrolase
MTEIERYRGCILGMAVGDAVGTTLEFRQPGTFEPLTDMVGGGPFFLNVGEWTDDTSMALCLAMSLLEKKGFDPVDQMERYVRWRQDGYMSSNGECFDIGGTVRMALDRFLETWEPYSGPTDENAAGNGSIMRLAPIPLYYTKASPVEFLEFAANSSRTTHGTQTCVDACKYMAVVIDGVLHGLTKEDLFSALFPLPESFHPQVQEIYEGSFKRKQPPEITGSGYVISTLEAALWAFWNTDNFKDGCLKVANLGLDSDSTAAVYGQIAGAYYGEQGIPEDWRKKVAHRQILERVADRLYAERYGNELVRAGV